jgi:hypothetical protein
MPAWLQRHPLIVALAFLAAVLAAVIAAELGLGGLEGSIPVAASKQASAPDVKLLPAVLAVAPEQAYPEIATRPLFTPTRRPAPEAVVQPTVVRGQYILLGITVAGNTRIAILKEKTSGRIHRVEKGKDIGSIKVAGVEPEVVTLSHGAEQEVLTLQVQRPVPAVPGAPAVVPTPAGGPFAPTAQQPTAAPPAALAPAPGAAPAAGAPPAGITSLMAPSGPMPVSPGAANPSPPAVPQAATAPMSPEELLARRRARRAQQTE